MQDIGLPEDLEDITLDTDETTDEALLAILEAEEATEESDEAEDKAEDAAAVFDAEDSDDADERATDAELEAALAVEAADEATAEAELIGDAAEEVAFCPSTTALNRNTRTRKAMLAMMAAVYGKFTWNELGRKDRPDRSAAACDASAGSFEKPCRKRGTFQLPAGSRPTSFGMGRTDKVRSGCSLRMKALRRRSMPN